MNFSAGAIGLLAVLWLVSGWGAMAAGRARSIEPFHYEADLTAGSPARLDVRADQPVGGRISRALYGKFTEHLGANVYGGIWAQVLDNPGFEGAEVFSTVPPSRRRAVMRERLADRERRLEVTGLRASFEAGVAPLWAAWGQGAAYALEGEAFNSDHCQRIDLPAGGRGGVQQPVFLPVYRVAKFGVTLAARSKGIRRLALSIRKGPKAGRPVSPAVAVGELASDWRKLEAELSVTDAAAKRGDLYWLRVEAAGAGSVWLDQVLLFPADHVSGFDPDVVRYCREAKLPLLRFPGGNFASGYHWEDGVGPVDRRPTRVNPAWNNVEYNHVGTQEMMAFCRAVGCEPMICVNAGDGTAEEAGRWVAYCNGGAATPMGALRGGHGHADPFNVRYWEVGNELYGGWQIGHCDAAEYAGRYAAFRRAMRGADPSIRLIANGHSPAWNAALVGANRRTVRSVSIHTLIGGGIPHDTDPARAFRALMGYTHQYPDVLRAAVAPMVRQKQAPRIAVTELQLFTGTWRLPNNKTLSEALWTASIINVAIRSQGMVEMVTHSALVNHGGGLSKRQGVVWADPVYYTHKLYGTQSGVQPLRVRYAGPAFDAEAPSLPAAKGVPVLDAVALASDDGREVTVIVVNREPRRGVRAAVRLQGFQAAPTVRVRALTGPSFMARNSFEQPDLVRLTESRAKAAADGLDWTFPEHSLTALVFRGKGR